MALKVPNTGELVLLDLLRTNWSLEIRLYQNNKTPADGDVLGDYTAATFSGYAPVAMSWPNPAADDGAGRAQAEADPVSFLHNGGGTANDIYGYYVTSGAGTQLVFAERFADAPIVMNSLGDALIITSRFTLKTEF